VLVVRKSKEAKTGSAKRAHDPKPISRADFLKLLDAGDEFDQALLLLSLNCCLYVSEVLSVEWEELNFDQRTYQSRRGKTDVIRAGVLWPRTVEALRKLPRRGGHVFRSSRGTVYHPNSYRKVFDDLRTRAGVAVEFNQIRDGAYTAAVRGGCAVVQCLILAGHCAPGQMDAYVARNPEMVVDAGAAVERHYFG
jgi:integrase